MLRRPEQVRRWSWPCRASGSSRTQTAVVVPTRTEASATTRSASGEADLEPGALDRHPAQLGLEGHLATHQVRRPVEPGQVPVARPPPDHTGCQMPVVRWYQMSCGAGRQSCLPRGWAGSSVGSSARTTTTCSPPSPSASVMSACERGVPALVAGDQLPVDPDLGPVVDRPEVQQHAAGPCRPGRSRTTRRYQTTGCTAGSWIPDSADSGGYGTWIVASKGPSSRDQPSRRPTSSSS